MLPFTNQKEISWLAPSHWLCYKFVGTAVPTNLSEPGFLLAVPTNLSEQYTFYNAAHFKDLYIQVGPTLMNFDLVLTLKVKPLI